MVWHTGMSCGRVDKSGCYNECQDSLLDVTRCSTYITILKNWFRNQDKVMILGHDDSHLRDKNMKVTVIFNHFEPNCNQRMPRVRHGYAHVANNIYQGWEQYAIGGSMSPSIKSKANFFVAPNDAGNKEQTGVGGAKHSYNREQDFKVVYAESIKELTSEFGVLRFSRSLMC
ncbi:putative pectate lyase 4 [Gossypium australe]|uniref:Pectate lyase n=1 Tax=Gossypium australe TaxID=47621 RepID=A0A5B6VI88_9ROSI|nr:putative pectate lyase 4 [Gossypium australe]